MNVYSNFLLLKPFLNIHIYCSTPVYSPLTNQNTAVIPACFVLKLNKPLPMCLPLIRQIQQIHAWTEIDSVPMQPILNLIVNHCSEGKMVSSTNKGLFVVSR